MPAMSGRYARRFSSESSNSDDDGPDLSALDSSAALVLLHDSEPEESNIPFNFTDDEDSDGDQASNLVSPVFDMRKSTVFPHLHPSLVFLYLLAPYLKLGALDLLNSRLPLTYGLIALFSSALASVFARQIWYMLARYMRKTDITEIVLDTFARNRRKERRRMVLRGSVRIGTSILFILVAVTYLRNAVYLLQPLFPRTLQPVLTYAIIMFLIAPVLGYLCYAKSLQSKRIIYTTSLSILTYVLWIGVTLYSYNHGLLESRTSWLGIGSFWPGIATIAFTFCTSSTLSLYTSLKITAQPISTTKISRSHSFRFLSFLSVIVAVFLLLPSLLISASSQSPSTVIPPNDILHSTAAVRTTRITVTPMSYSIPFFSLPLPTDLNPLLVELQTILASLTLIFGIPSVVVTTPPPTLPGLRSVKFNAPRVSNIFFVLLLASIPPHSFINLDREHPTDGDHSYLASSGISAVLTAALMVMALLSTYFLPALVHISTHLFKRPLSIVIPRKSVRPAPNLTSSVGHGIASTSSSPTDAVRDLLLRKERALQKKQFRKRIAWDIGVWTLLFTSMALVVFTICGFVGVWQP